MSSNFFHFTKMQIYSLSHIVWLQLLCIILFPMFFSQLNVNNDYANVIIFSCGLLMASYLILRNFAFNDAKYKTKLLFSTLPVKKEEIIGARGIIIYLFCLIATPILVLSSNIIHLIKPDMFAAISLHIIPYGILLATLFLPIEFLIFYLFEAQKADIIGAIACFPYMGMMFLVYHYFLNSPLWIVVLFLALILNIICYMVSLSRYKNTPA